MIPGPAKYHLNGTVKNPCSTIGGNRFKVAWNRVLVFESVYEKVNNPVWNQKKTYRYQPKC